MVAIKAILIHRRLKKKTTHKTVKGTSIRLFFCFISCSPSLFFPYFSFSENSVVNRTKSFCFSVELGKSVKITRGRHNALYCCVQRPFAIHSHLMLFCEPWIPWIVYVYSRAMEEHIFNVPFNTIHTLFIYATCVYTISKNTVSSLFSPKIYLLHMHKPSIVLPK